MSYSYRLPKARQGNRTLNMRPVGRGLDGVLSALGGQEAAEKRRLARLWENWHMVMGQDMAEMAVPLGHRGSILLVGGDDNLVLQDLTFMSPEILERVNAFMDSAFFSRVELHLLMGRTSLDVAPVLQPTTRVRPVPVRPPHLYGAALRDADPDSPVARCYRAYVQMHERLHALSGL